MATLTPSKLTPKQESFCQKYIELGNASEAYRQSYDCQNMKETTVNNKAYELLQKGEITARISELQNNHQERHNTTVDDLLANLDELYTVAITSGNLQVAYNIIMGKGKLLGLAKQAQLEIELKKLELERLRIDKGIQEPKPVQVIVEVKNASRNTDT